MDRVDRGQRSSLGQVERGQLRRPRPAQDDIVAPGAESQPRQSLGLLRPRQRALLRESDGARSRPLRSLARQAASGLSARSLRERGQVSRRDSRRARDRVPGRQEAAGRLVLWLRHRHRGPAPVPQSRVRRRGREALERREVLHRCGLLPAGGAGAALPRRHVVRVLPRGAESDQPPGRPREPQVGEPLVQRRRPVLLDRSDLRLGRQPVELHLPDVPFLPPRARWTPPWSPPTTSTTRAR